MVVGAVVVVVAVVVGAAVVVTIGAVVVGAVVVGSGIVVVAGTVVDDTVDSVMPVVDEATVSGIPLEELQPVMTRATSRQASVLMVRAYGRHPALGASRDQPAVPRR